MGGSVGGTSTINSDDRLLLQVLDHDALSASGGGSATGGRGGPSSSAGGTGGSVSMSDLLDLLERSVNDRDDQLGVVSKSGNSVVGAAGGHGDGGSANNRRGRAVRRLSSESKLGSSFTSRLLGGQTDDDVEVLPSTSPSTNNGNGLANKNDHPHINNDLAPVTDNSDGGGSVHSLDRSINYSSDRSLDRSHDKSQQSSTSKQQHSFDNPFRSSSSRSSSRTMQTTTASSARGGGGKGEDDANSMGSWGRLYPSDGSSNNNSRGDKLNLRNRSKNSNSVTFSIQESNREDNQSIDDTTTSAAGFSLGSLASGGYEVSVSTRSSRSSRQSNRSNKSKSSHDSGASGTSNVSSTHSSQHSGDSTQERRRRRELVPVKKNDTGDPPTPAAVMQTSSSGVGSELSLATTGERHTKNQQQQRKQLTKKSSTLSSTTKTTAATAATDGGGVSATVNKHQPKRNLRKKSSSMSSGGSSRSSRSSRSSNSGDSEINEGNEEFRGKNLHNHHPVRYPRRSSNPFDEVGEEFDGAGDVIAPAHRRHNHHRPNDDDDEDGLFRRVSRVRDSGNSDSAGKLKTTDFLDGLIASTTTVKRNGGIIGSGGGGGVDADDGVSVDDQSFLSELLARNNSARQRGLGTRRGIVDNSTVTSGTTLSSHTTLRNSSESDKIDFINIYALDANTKQHQQQKRERKQRRSKHQWRFDIMGVKQQYDLVMLKVRQSYVYQQIVEQCEEGGKCKLMLDNMRTSNMYNKLQRWYNEGGNILPQNRKEIVMFLVCALLLWPLVHVAITIVTGSYVYDNNSSSGGGRTRGGRNNGAAYYGSEIQVGGSSRYNIRKNNKSPGLYSMGESMNTWAGSSQVMLSSRSSLREDFILIPDADWIELQILRSKVASSKFKSDNNRGGDGDGDGGGYFSSFFRKQSNSAASYDMTSRKPPKRLPLPPILDPVYNTTASIVLFTINCGPLRQDKEMVWRLLQSVLLPRPLDVWPSWSHNSLAQYREDGFTVMYPLRLRGEARIALTKLVNKKVVDQSYIYEYLTWSETTSQPNIGDSSGVRGGSAGSVEERISSVRLVGKDGSAIVIPKLPNGRSDIMIRRTISTTTDSVLSDPEDEPTVIMRRVMDLPVEDELTMKEWEGPLEEIVWSKDTKLKKGRMPS